MTEVTTTMCGALPGLSESGSKIETREAWYCLRSQRKREHFAAAHLRQIPGVEVFNPQLKLVRATRRGQVWTTESLFPNYLFARFGLEKLLEKVRFTPSVKSVLQFGDRVPAIADSVIEELRQTLGASEPRVFTDEPLPGEEAEISTGPFEGEKGVVTRVLPAKQRVQILLDVMGRSISAEFSLDTVLFKRRQAVDFILGPAEKCSVAVLARPLSNEIAGRALSGGAI